LHRDEFLTRLRFAEAALAEALEAGFENLGDAGNSQAAHGAGVVCQLG